MVLSNLFGAQPEPPPKAAHESRLFTGPYGLQRFHAHQHRQRLTRSLYVGATADGMVYTGPDEHMLFAAGPRSSYGKSTHTATAALIKHPGPVAFFTSKAHGIITATAQVRAAIAGDPADVMHMNFDGEPLPGLTGLRWSLPAHAEGDYDLIEDAIRQEASVSLGQGDAKQAFWTESAIVYVATVWTALSLRYMAGNFKPWRQEDPYGSTERFGARLIRRSDFQTDMPELAAELIRAGREDLADNLLALAKMPHETREGICANARVIIRPYNREKIVRTTDNPNFDMRAFVRGEPDAPNAEMDIPPDALQGFEGHRARGRWPTVYFTGQDQRAVAPHMAMMAAVLVRTCAESAEECERLRNEQPQPVLIASDEMGTIAPWQSLPEDAAKGGNGYILLMGFQSLNQAVDRHGKQILSLAQNIALGPGLRDEELELFSKLNGQTYIEKVSEGESETRGKDTSQGASYNYDWVQVPRIPVDAIANGYPGQPGAFSYFPANTSAHQWVHSTPYFRSAPWFHILMNEAFRVARHGSEAQLRLPLPVMHRHGFMHPSLDARAITAYHDLIRKWAEARAQKGIR